MRLGFGKSRGALLGLVLTALTTLIVLAFGLRKPYDNWDMVGYVAVAFHAEGVRGEALNRATYASIRKDVDASTFNQLAGGDPYRETVFHDPVALEQQLPFYSIRVVYMGTVRAVHALGVGYPGSTWVVSAVFAALSVVLLAFVSREAGVPLAAIPLVVAIAGFVDVARLSTPDAMATCFALLAIYCLIRRSILLYVVVIALPLVRTDFLLLSGLILAYTFITGARARSTVAMVLAAGAYVLVVKTLAGYGWLTLFNTSLIAKTPYPATLVPSRIIADYIRPYVSNTYGFTMHPHFAVYGLAIAWWLLGKERKNDEGDELVYPMLAIPLAFVALHFMLFPANTYRYFVFAAALVALWLMGRMRRDAGR